MKKWWLSTDEMKNYIKPKEKRIEAIVNYERAYWHWYRSYWSPELDDDFKVLVPVAPPIKDGWLRFTRNAQLGSVKNLASRLKITESAYVQLEKSEKEKRITMKRLAEVAEGLNCELVYFLRPKNGARISEYVWKQLYDFFKDDPLIEAAPEKHRYKVIASVVKRGFAKMKNRQEMGWSLKKDEKPRKNQSRFFF